MGLDMDYSLIMESANKQRKNIVEVAYKARQGHLSSSFSIIEVLNILYKKVMAFDVQNPDSIENDQMILSKGHASLALYAILYDLGVISKEQFFSFSEFDSILGEHPDRNKVPGVSISTGSLGHGMPSAVGMAIGYKAKKMNNRVFCIMGDGEANEGSIWEAANVASLLKLTNIVCIVDDNNSASHMPNVGDKFKAFGWAVTEIDGHNYEEIENALKMKTDKPHMVWSHSIKGYGSKLMQNDPEGWHHRIINANEYEILKEELK